MINKKLLQELNKVEDINENELYIKIINVSNFNILIIRDYLMIHSSIVKEDLKNNIYISYFKSGLMHLNRSLIGIILEKNKLTIVGYSGNNITNKNSSKKIVERIISELFQNKKINNKKNYLIITIISICLIFIIYGYININNAITATKNYNKAVNNFNIMAKKYNEDINSISVDNIEGVPSKITLLKQENDNFFSIAKSIIKGNSTTKIKNDETTIYSMTDKIKDSERIITQIKEPSTELVESKLKNIKEIKNIKAVNPNNDPNKLLNKKNGYSACIYFTVAGIKFNNINSEDPIVLGTNGGGCIEVYHTKTDAMNRCEYLKQFNNTILYSGSYALVGTMVIRTSYVLTDTQQYTLTDLIIKEFTK